MTFTLAASAEMLYLDLPFADRVKRITERGLQVEIWDWSTKDIDALAASGATFSSMTGYLQRRPHHAGRDRGAARHRGGVARGRRAARLPPAEPARHRARRRGPAGAPGRGRHADDVAHRGRHPAPDRRPRRPRRAGVHAGEPQPGRRPPRHAVRARRRHAGARPRGRPARTCGSTWTSTTPRSARGTSSSSSARRCPTSARSRWPTCRAAASRAPARSTTGRSPRRSDAAGYTGVVGLEAWAGRVTRTPRSTRSRRRSPWADGRSGGASRGNVRSPRTCATARTGSLPCVAGATRRARGATPGRCATARGWPTVITCRRP